MAESVAESVSDRDDMNLVAGSYLSCAKVDQIVESETLLTPCAIVVIGHPEETAELQQKWLAARKSLVVMRVDIVGDIVRIGLRDPRLDWILTVLRELVESFDESHERAAHIQLQLGEPGDPASELPAAEMQTPLLDASIEWIRALLLSSVDNMPNENGDVHGFSLSRSTVSQSLNAPRIAVDQESALHEAEDRLDAVLEDQDNPEPLAVAVRVFGLVKLEFRVMMLTLSPELDFHFQRCLGFLLDDLSRRVGTLGLYASLLHLTPRQLGEVRGGPLARWQVFDDPNGFPKAADEPARIDPFLVQWILGEESVLENDPRVRSLLRFERWPGSSLLIDSREQRKAQKLVNKIRHMDGTRLLVLNGSAFADWRALLELGSKLTGIGLIRVEASGLKGIDPNEIRSCARSLARAASLTGKVLAIDIATAEIEQAEHSGIRQFLTTLRSLDCGAALVCPDLAEMVSFLDGVSFLPVKGEAISAESRFNAVIEAAAQAEVGGEDETADISANKFPLGVDELAQAVRLAKIRPLLESADEPELERFYEACKDLSLRGVSQLVDRIDPVFTLDDIVLPPDRKRQLYEIVDHVRLADRVLDDWNFGEKLPYGRGVTVLFSGVSGTGKTMAAMGIAHSLGIQILRLDLSKIVSKYIGETEKNISRVFADAQKSGAAVLIDEADALLGKRSEVKLAQDRYANIEVAYLLQCLEAFEGLVILTSNMRQNLDSAFLRRLRFSIEFGKPNGDARELIWRQCLPAKSHDLDDADFRHLARRLDLTGGQIRQITLRAAFIAAAADNLIGMEEISEATHAELTKLGLPPIELVSTELRRAA